MSLRPDKKKVKELLIILSKGYPEDDAKGDKYCETVNAFTDPEFFIGWLMDQAWDYEAVMRWIAECMTVATDHRGGFDT